MYFARSANQRGIKQTLKQHLERVADLAAMFADEFDSKLEGQIAGLYHDFGKYSISFQKVLEGSKQNVNHSVAGSAVVYIRYKPELMPVVYSIYAHHSNLDCCIEGVIKESLLADDTCYDSDGKELAIAGVEEYKKYLRIFDSEIVSPKERIRRVDFDYCLNKNIAAMLHTRFIYSVLVDADYISAAEHFDEIHFERVKGQQLDAKSILDNLLDYQKEVRRNSSADTDLNRIREDLFSSCLLAAEEIPGLFTLTAPTGTGKTLSLFAFALKHALKWNKRRIIIILPYLSIIDQNVKVYKRITEHILEDHSQSKLDEESRLYAERWSSPIVVTTAVKFFETLFSSKPTECRKLHNIANSVIVFDEAQFLPSHLIGATLESVNALCCRYKCSVVFSTATQPSFDYRDDVKWEPREIVKNNKVMYEKSKRVNVEWCLNERLSFAEIAMHLADIPSYCVIVNTKKHARELYRIISDGIVNKDELFYVTTNMCAKHRMDKLEQIRYRLDNGLPCKLIATQCIEAGVDIDFPVLYRALAPLESIIQAAGRCNRNGLLEKGKVVVFEPENDAGVLYPSKHYELAANKVKYMLSKYDIDIYNQEHIDEYYRLLYQDNLNDIKRLRDAIIKFDFINTDKYYKIIEDGGLNIIVPYECCISLFEEIKEEALTNGLTNEIIARARPITVSSYDAEAVKIYCEMLRFKSYRNRNGIESNWYLLCDSKKYNNDIGLDIDKNIFDKLIM